MEDIIAIQWTKYDLYTHEYDDVTSDQCFVSQLWFWKELYNIKQGKLSQWTLFLNFLNSCIDIFSYVYL